jgi:TolA-binding protein
MRKGWLLVAAALLATSCGTDREISRLYRAERELWQADSEYRNLSIRPERVAEDVWFGLARRYVSIADKCVATPGTHAAGSASEGTQAVAARALFSAARIHAALRDSSGMELLYERMAQQFGDLPSVAAEVAMIRAGIAESRGERLAAAELYESVIGRAEPETGAAGIAGVVLGLPLRIARLRAVGATDQARDAAYREARAYYERYARDHADERVRIDCEFHLVEIAKDLSRWDEALAVLQQLRTHVQEFTDNHDPELAPRVLLELASNAGRRGQASEALGYLDRIAKEHSDAPETASWALLARGQLLDNQARWPEALDSYRSIPILFPQSEAALQAPLDIVLHYAQAGDDDGAAAALSQAERDYRDFLTRYPPGRLTLMAREHLARTLALQHKYDAAVTEWLSLGEDLAGSSQGASFLLTAARIAYTQLADTTRATAILEHIAQVYSRATVGKWAADEATRLRGLKSS